MPNQGKLHSRQENVPRQHRVSRTGDWLPNDHRLHKEWLNGVIEHVDNNPTELHPILQEFQYLIDTNARVYMLVQSMFEQVPSKRPYMHDPTGHRQIRDSDHMLRLLNHLITTAPHWTDRAHRVGMVGCPINAVLDWPMGTPSGFAFFLDRDVNALLKKLLDAWGAFLCSEESAQQVLHDGPGGWFAPHGLHDLATMADAAGGTALAFEDFFECDTSRTHYGFTSWDAFFTRNFRPGIRPVAAPDDDSVIANACESRPCAVGRDVPLRARFWVKGQPYSVADMLAHDACAPQFAGGTVYQAFLSALSYHRWHAPVSGHVVRAYVCPGTYYSEPLFTGVGDPANAASGQIDEAGENEAQPYLAAVATRALILIEADNPAIGLMAFLGVGMVEVSTCEITVKEGQHVRKGDQLGMFHFGGSTHCLMFRKGVDLEGFPEPGGEHNVPVCSQLAVVKGGRL